MVEERHVSIGRTVFGILCYGFAIPCPWFPPAGCGIGLVATRTSQRVPWDWSDRHPVGSVVKSNLVFFPWDTDLTLPALFLPSSSSSQLCLILNSCLKSLNFPQPSVTDLRALITDYSFQGLFYAVFSVHCETETHHREGNQISDNDIAGHKWINQQIPSFQLFAFNRSNLQGWIFPFQFLFGCLNHMQYFANIDFHLMCKNNEMNNFSTDGSCNTVLVPNIQGSF